MSNRGSFLKRVVNRLIEARERGVQRHVRQYLRGLSDRQLEDMGFSRELLEQGPQAWPWRAPVGASATSAWGHGRNRDGIAQAADYVRRDREQAVQPVTTDDKLAA